MGFSLLLDRLFYGHWTSSIFNFLQINVIENIATFYGVHPIHWYFSQAIPLILFTATPVAIYGVWKGGNKRSDLAWMCAFATGFLSLQGHKEFRFLFPLLAPMLVYVGKGLVGLKKKTLARTIVFIFLTNLMMAIYFGMIHKRGVVAVILWLRSQVYAPSTNEMGILFLMPCHSTPYYSHIHKPVSMRFVSCEPPLGYDRR